MKVAEHSMIRKSMDPEGIYDSPLNQGRVDKAYENLEVRVIHYPNERDWKLTATLAGAGHAGSSFNPVEYVDLHKIDDIISSDLWKGGHGQAKESDTVTFLIYGLSRGLTHEMVRTRQAWFLQQAMRHTLCRQANFRMPEYVANSSEDIQKRWLETVEHCRETYDILTLGADMPYQDARTVLPIATETWIVCGYPVRAWLETYAYRACSMFYPEMVWVFREMKRKLMEVCPWIAEQAKITCEISNMCEYQGVENTHELCDFPWAHIRKWKSAAFAHRVESKDVLWTEHDKNNCELCNCI